ncbi:MAG: autotransporter-associated beta strand repeat-containing protein [Akkermansia sp.]|nr:autotransporter-associated beta strand repeat-containing protein [Akkermansia sp.]
MAGNSTLFFANAGETYDMTSTTIQGFSHLSLADDTYVKLTTNDNHFGTDNASGLLTISGTGKVELTGSTDLARDITLVDGATLWINSNHVGNVIDTTDSRYTITATAGTTLEVTGRPNPGEDEGLTLWLDLAGHGVNDMGALYKAATGSSDPSGKVALPRVTFSDSASINTEASIYWIECRNEPSDVYLNGNTLTKIGDQSLVIYNADVVDNSASDADTAVDGTFFVKEGTLGIGYGMRAAKTNVVLSQGTTLDIVAQGNNEATIGALSGSGSVVLNNTFTIHTSAAGSYGAGSDWMTQGADKYGQFDSDAGFAYGVFSGSISGAQALSLSGDGTQYFSGSGSTFSGGVKMQDAATLYLMGSTEGSASMGSSSATAGAVGTGTISWDSANAKLYLGNGVQVFNNGTTNVAGSNMIIGVEAAPKGDALTNYMGTHDSVIMNGTEYVEVDTHNLQSISCNGKYADGTIYQPGELIDRDKMLLVEKSTWDAGQATVAGFSAGGYNTATYSGVLSGNANLMKVGAGTLILDQSNTYTGSTIIDAGSLVLKGWAKIGGSSTTAALNVEQKAGSTLMLAYDGSYGNEITGIANDMSISGTGDVRWTTESATGYATAALISAVSGKEKFTLSGNISGDGNLLHTASGTLVLSGDSSYTGGTHATMGVLEVQSASGMGSGKVVMEKEADLHVTVEDGTAASRLTTTVKAADSHIDGDVIINGTADTERVLNMSTAGYNATSTKLNDTGVLLVNGAGVQADSALLSGTGTLAVSDATSSGATAQIGGLMDYSGDFVVEGSNASISVEQGNFNGGSLSVSGQGAKVALESGYVHVAQGKNLDLSSEGSASTGTAAIVQASSVTVDSGATLSVDNNATHYQYNLEKLAADASLAPNPGELVTFGSGQNVPLDSIEGEEAYSYHFDAERAMNAQSAAVVDATQGLTLNGGSRYEAECANINLAGGALTLNTSGGKIALDLLTEGNIVTYDDGCTSQIVLFTGVSSLTLDGTPYGEANALMMMVAADGEEAQASNIIYSTLASNYFTGWNITDATQLVYDVGAGVVYLDKAVPEPTTTTLSLLALAALVARRRRK